MDPPSTLIRIKEIQHSPSQELAGIDSWLSLHAKDPTY